MSEKPLFCRRFRAIKRNGPEGATNTPPALTITDAVKEHRAMAVDSQYTDSESEINQNNTGTWQSIGAVDARLVEKARK